MTNNNAVVSLAWIDEISAPRPKPSPLEVACWLDSLFVAGLPIRPDLSDDMFSKMEPCVRAWPPRLKT